jgi:hypothetical protein
VGSIRNRAAGVVAISAATAAFAQSPPATLVLKGGRLFDAESATTRANGQLWIAGERIVGVKPEDAQIPDGVKVVELGDATILPGLFDLHVHIAVPGAASGPGVMLDPAENLATHLAFGVLHAVDLHNVPDSVFPLRDRSRKDPALARLFAAGARGAGAHGDREAGPRGGQEALLPRLDARRGEDGGARRRRRARPRRLRRDGRRRADRPDEGARDRLRPDARRRRRPAADRAEE